MIGKMKFRSLGTRLARDLLPATVRMGIKRKLDKSLSRINYLLFYLARRNSTDY